MGEAREDVQETQALGVEGAHLSRDRLEVVPDFGGDGHRGGRRRQPKREHECTEHNPREPPLPMGRRRFSRRSRPRC